MGAGRRILSHLHTLAVRRALDGLTGKSSAFCTAGQWWEGCVLYRTWPGRLAHELTQSNSCFSTDNQEVMGFVPYLWLRKSEIFFKYLTFLFKNKDCKMTLLNTGCDTTSGSCHVFSWG